MNTERRQPVIALGITGGIAAYKAAELCSRLMQDGYEVHVVMTAAAQQFVTPLTFRTLSRQPVLTSLWDVPQWQPGHVALADLAGLLAIVPCTVNMLGKIANGIADDALSTLAAAFDGPVLMAPAANPKMWKNPAVQENVTRLKARGVHFAGPETGHVACGADGTGRMTEPAAIRAAIHALLPVPGAEK